jgi:thioredoxin-dependent peroxiredoxin
LIEDGGKPLAHRRRCDTIILSQGSSECRSKFPVAADGDQRTMKAYDAVMMGFLSYANRTSYVIAPDGHIIYEHTALDPSNHVENTLAAVRSWKSEQK